jgi:squalene-hopene/tetraprenyl-beta-curcumene cyclase
MQSDPGDISQSGSQALADATRRLLERRTSNGTWEGELSSSALSTATAVFALVMFAGRQQPDLTILIEGGIAWLLKHQNSDGGWGDTTLSKSNISTTTLCWAALSIAKNDALPAIALTEAWLTRAAGSLDPDVLAEAIARRYGKDRTFSVPILTMCALSGRLGLWPTAWRHIAQLPFELAAFPQSWFRFVRLPVVSYALPALISMGLAKHHHSPTWNPLARLLRWLTTKRVLKVLKQIQPANGGFLEAIPLTSFVVMSLIGARRGDHPAVRLAVDFLVRSARADGSWPIDTNLATWITTLSINALAAKGGSAAVAKIVNAEDRAKIRKWLLGQQYRVRHPYTGAPPGAWAWTDLPGGVPDADDTAGALLALHHLGDIDTAVLQAAESGINWLINMQNRDGGIPTFCKGWTNLPFDRSGADLTAHALQAWRIWRDQVHPNLAARISKAEARALRYLTRVQSAEGSWTPLWFGNQYAPDEENRTYGTARVLIGLLTLGKATPSADRAIHWLLAAQNPDGGWGGAKSVVSSIEETGLATQALAMAADHTKTAIPDAVARARAWLVQRTALGEFPPAPIGFYFAKLWYFERDYPLIYTIGGLRRQM